MSGHPLGPVLDEINVMVENKLASDDIVQKLLKRRKKVLKELELIEQALNQQQRKVLLEVMSKYFTVKPGVLR